MSDFVRAYYGDAWMGLVIGLWRLTQSIAISVKILERSVEIVKAKVSYDSSLLRYETYMNDKLHGRSQLVRADGSVLTAKMYRNGLKEGSFRMWYSNGQLRDSYEYDKGVLHGFYKHWHSNGQLSEMSMYGNGKIHGLFQKWNMRGQLISESFYRAGTRVGVIKNWSPTGELLSPDDIPTYDLILAMACSTTYPLAVFRFQEIDFAGITPTWTPWAFANTESRA